MKNYVVFCFFALLAVALGTPVEKYTDKYDNINMEEIMTNKVLLMRYIKCVLDEGKCTTEGRELKSHIKEALETKCAKCTNVQKAETRRMITFLINEQPVYWNQLTAKYDPTKKYTILYEKELKKIKA